VARASNSRKLVSELPVAYPFAVFAKGGRFYSDSSTC
jgi:hypothetical protein